jgi:exoribonuclease R
MNLKRFSRLIGRWKLIRRTCYLLWASIDNSDSLDLDQLTVAEALPDKSVRILVAVADVDARAKKNSAIDEHARQNTTSVYTAGKTFPMLPERLSTDLTSLNYQEDRPAIVIEMIISDEGEINSSDIYHATVRNHAKLAYNSIAAWLEGKGPAPVQAFAIGPSLAKNLRVQDRVAQKLRSQRHKRGALDLQTLEARPAMLRRWLPIAPPCESSVSRRWRMNSRSGCPVPLNALMGILPRRRQMPSNGISG